MLQFHRLITEGRAPMRADRSALGTLPTRAYRYCDAVTSASGYGWWVFSPIDMQLIWDGTDVHWWHDGADGWMRLSPSAQFPGFMDTFDSMAPSALRGCAPPFLTALPEPGVVQLWTGLMARTDDGWSLNVRPPANLPAPSGCSLYEGIVETDRWFGPLFTNIRLTRTNEAVHLKADYPLLQVQPLQRASYEAVPGAVGNMGAADWAEYHANIVVPCEDPDRPFGAYSVAVRKRRQGGCPVAH